MSASLPDILTWMQTGVDHMGGDGSAFDLAARRNWPPVDIIETPENLYVYIEIPGITSENVEVEFYNNVILVSGTKARPRSDNISNSTMKEIKYGDFSRRILIPLCVTRKESVNISFQRGVMTVDIDKAVESQNRFSVSVTESVD
jgi:HSP20 family molecular chaperone IbpA